MKEGHINLEDAVTNMYQLGSHGREPQAYIYVYNRFYKQKGDVFYAEKGRLPGVIEASVNWSTESTAGSFSVTVENTEGMMTPEYSYGKVPLDEAWRGHLHSPWRGQIVPNNKMEFWFGYGNEVLLEMTGLIDDVTINADEKTMTISGRSMYKLAIDNTCKPYPGYEHTIPFNTMRIVDGIGRLVNYAGLPFKGKEIIDEATNEKFIVGQPLGERGEDYHSVIEGLINPIFHYLRETPDGKIEMLELPKFSEDDKPDFVIDEERHIMSLEYSYDDTNLYGTVIVESNKIQDAFSSHFITEEFLGGQRREIILDYPWANSKYKRRLAAQSEFTRMLYKARTVSVTIPANPMLQLYDSVRVLEKISLARWTYHIRSITTDISADGFTQTLDLTVNTGFESPGSPPPPQTSLPPVRPSTETVTLGVWDGGAVDLDVIAIKLNGESVTDSLILEETATTFSLTLEKGRNVLEFTGISAGRSGGITIAMYIEDENGNLLTPEGATIVMPRGKTDKYGFIRGKKPVRNWVINRA